MPAMEHPSLVADLVEFVKDEPRPYREVMNAWRTSCPRLTIWEDAVDHGLVVLKGQHVDITPEGRQFLARYR